MNDVSTYAKRQKMNDLKRNKTIEFSSKNDSISNVLYFSLSLTHGKNFEIDVAIDVDVDVNPDNASSSSFAAARKKLEQNGS